MKEEVGGRRLQVDGVGVIGEGRCADLGEEEGFGR